MCRTRCRVRGAGCRVLVLGAGCLVLGAATVAFAQMPQPVERVSFQEAIDRALKNNPTVAAAAAGILRAEGLLRQSRAVTLLQVNGLITTTTLNRSVKFQDTTVTPQNQIAASLTADMPIVAAAAWARRAQAEDQVHVAELNAADVRRQIAFATADAYLSILASRRVVQTATTARDVAKAHYDLANQLEERGTGSHLNTLRAQQQWSTDEQLAEAAGLAVYRAQEALGVLIVAAGPVDATDEPTFDIPADAATIAVQSGNIAQSLLPIRTDLKLFSAEQDAAERVVRDSSKDYWPSLDAIFQPQTVYPAQFFLPMNSWRLLFQANVPIWDSGQRASLKVQRQAALNETQSRFAGGMTTASSEVRSAREAVASGERGLGSARAAADQAQQVVNITNLSFRAGAATNIEVIDAQRTARDTDAAVAIAEDNLRRARLDLLTALGHFP